jgi:hypothetical protein
MKKTWIAGLATVAMMGLGAIWADTAKTERAPVVAQTPTESADPIAPSAQIEVLEQGAEPRQVIQLSVPENAQQTMTMTLQLNLAMSFAGQPAETFPTPTVQLTMATESGAANENGEIPIRFVTTAANVIEGTTSAEMVAAVRSQLERQIGTGGSYSIDRQGQIRDVNLILPNQQDPASALIAKQIVNAMVQSTTRRYPDTPIGQGAQWRVVIPNSQLSFFTANAVETYELTSLQGDQMTVNLTLEHQSGAQPIDAQSFPGLPAGLNVELQSFTMQGTGTLTQALEALGPSYSMFSSTSNLSFEVTPPDTQEKLPVTLQSDMNMTIEAN